jgi:hypothetical protein
MKKLSEVENAKTLMTEAMKWSVMKWLREKKNVRKTADLANAALDKFSDSVRQSWPATVRTAYEVLASGNGSATHKKPEQPTNSRAAVDKYKQADDEAYRARTVAEETFDRAERLLSTSLAREGCSKAICSWELKEKAIRLAEEIAQSAKV